MSEGAYSIPARCGKDFCECCGDCLHCYGGEECYDDCGTHVSWVTVTKAEAAKRYGGEAEQYRITEEPNAD